MSTKFPCSLRPVVVIEQNMLALAAVVHGQRTSTSTLCDDKADKPPDNCVETVRKHPTQVSGKTIGDIMSVGIFARSGGVRAG
jgi:hypothetical protein